VTTESIAGGVHEEVAPALFRVTPSRASPAIMLAEMRPISRRRHAGALRKELAFWQGQRILERQAFRTQRYTRPVLAATNRYGPDRIENVLDIGCGPAGVAGLIPAGTKWYLDPLLGDFERLFPGRLSDGVKLPVGIEEARLEDDFFDIVLMLNALDHVRDPWLALVKIHNALRPGGMLIVSCYVRPVVIAFLRNAQERVHCSTDRAHPFTFTRVSAERDLLRAGFTIESAVILEQDRIRSEILWTCSALPANR
jgi:SAM-dependent methyltransferase